MNFRSRIHTKSYPASTSGISFWKVAGAFSRPYGITRNSNAVYSGVIKAVYGDILEQSVTRFGERLLKDG